VRPAAERSGRELVVAVGLKMYFGYRETLDWCAQVRSLATSSPVVNGGAVRLIVLPASPFLVPVVEMFRGTPIEVGAQNMYFEDRGAFTGEVSGSMLAELGCRYIEVGHAERRCLFGEDEHMVALKVEAAARNRLHPIVCVGETEAMGAAAAARESMRQLESALSRAHVPVIVAYEPLWAIGADRPATEDHIVQVCLALKGIQRSAEDRVIYGGSAGPGLLKRIGHSVDGLFLGRYVHDATALESVLEEAALLA
jgi:triosephosphate isomerase